MFSCKDGCVDFLAKYRSWVQFDVAVFGQSLLYSVEDWVCRNVESVQSQRTAILSTTHVVFQS